MGIRGYFGHFLGFDGYLDNFLGFERILVIFRFWEYFGHFKVSGDILVILGFRGVFWIFFGF